MTLPDAKKRPRSDKPTVACVACGRVVVASKNGHPRRHAPKSGKRPEERGTCAGTFEKGDAP